MNIKLKAALTTLWFFSVAIGIGLLAATVMAAFTPMQLAAGALAAVFLIMVYAVYLGNLDKLEREAQK